MPEEVVETKPAEVKAADNLNTILEQTIKDNQAKLKVKPETKAVDAKPEDEKTDEKPSEPVLSEEELSHAKNLFLLLKDKDTARATLEILAKQAGLIETKKEAQAVVKSIIEVLKEELGEEYAFMADKLAPAIEKTVRTLVEENVRDLREEFRNQSEAKISKEVDDGIEYLGETFEDVETYYKAIYELMDRYPPDAKISAKEYFTDLYHLAKSKKAATSPSEKLKAKVEKNRNDAASRLASGGKGTAREGVTLSKSMGIDDSIRAALESIKE